MSNHGNKNNRFMSIHNSPNQPTFYVLLPKPIHQMNPTNQL